VAQLLNAITRLPSRRMDACELSHLTRVPIDHVKALRQHAAYCRALIECGARVQVLAADDTLPDCAFVEDMALVLPELNVLCRSGAASRRGELAAIASALPGDRPTTRIEGPGTIDGGDVLVVGRRLFIGKTRRTNEQGIAALRILLEPHGYQISAVPVSGALHFKSACTALDSNTLLINRAWVDASLFEGFTLIDVADDEPFAANILTLAERVLVQAAHPVTAQAIEARGFRTIALDISEFSKAEAALTCMSLLYNSSP
jgi:dimethylargininase